MRGMSLLLLAGALAACTTAPEARSPRAEAQLRDLLAGKVAEQPVSCLPSSRSDDTIVLDNSTVLFRQRGRLYRNDFNGGTCNGLNWGSTTLVTRQFGGTGLCRGDIAQVVDTSSGSVIGSCVLGDFVPYRSR